MALVLPIWSPSQGDVNLTAALLNQILGEQGSSITNTNITTVGAGTLTAAGLVGGQISRTGPVAAYTDTTDTAANIVTALGGFVAGLTFFARIKNSVPYLQTLAGSTGVTFGTTQVVPPLGICNLFGTVGGTSDSPTVVFTHVNTSAIYLASVVADPIASALSTVGAGTILAASINSGVTTRSGTQTVAITDTTDTAANIIAGVTSLTNITGSACEWKYVNNTIFPVTVHAGASVTLTDVVIPANSWANFLVTKTGATTVTIIVTEQGFFPHSGTFVCNGVTPVTVADANFTANSSVIISLKTVGGTVGALPHPATVTPQTGFTTVGTVSDTSTYTYTILG